MTALDDISAWIQATFGQIPTHGQTEELLTKLEYWRLEDEKAFLQRIQGLINQAIPIAYVAPPDSAWDPKLKVVMSRRQPRFMDPGATAVERHKRGLEPWTPDLGAKEQNEPPIT